MGAGGMSIGQYSVLRILLLGCSFCLAKNGDIYIGKHSAEEGAKVALRRVVASGRAIGQIASKGGAEPKAVSLGQAAYHPHLTMCS